LGRRESEFLHRREGPGGGGGDEGMEEDEEDEEHRVAME